VQKKAQVHESVDHAHFLEKNIICNTSPTEKSRQGCFTPENSFLNHFLTKKTSKRPKYTRLCLQITKKGSKNTKSIQNIKIFRGQIYSLK
jgi:hypothetical protein